MSAIKRLRNNYVIWHANKIHIPNFEPSTKVRKKVLFSGRVQKVGFRLELFTLAQRLKLTGWVKNLADRSVEAELQGEESKIDFLIESMKSLKRASVKKCDASIIPINKNDEEFKLIK